MPVPKYSTAVPSTPLAPEEDHDADVTELRVHGVSGTPADALLADLAPARVWGDSVAGFYRSAQRDAPGEGAGQCGRGARRNVEAYSWGGLTSGSSWRVLWLVLLPFLLGNLSGWMCSRRTRDNGALFTFHRAACGLGSLGLTVNAAFAIALITADVAGYQAVRAGVVKNSWWLAPMGWPEIAGHPGRQVLVGIFAATLVVLAIHLLVGKSWRYEKVRPPHNGGAEPPGPARLVTAAALKGGLRHKDFWDGARSAAVLAWAHSGSYAAFLTIVLCVTARSATGGAVAGAGSAALFWIAACAGGAALAGCALYLVADAVAGPHEVRAIRGVPKALAGLACAGLACAGAFAWLQPAATNTAPNLPGITTIFHWTALGLAACAVLVACSVILGLDGQWRSAFAGAPLACVLLGFGLLNMTLLCFLDWIANLAGPVTVSKQVPEGMLYVPELVWYGAPMMAWALAAAVFLFFTAGLIYELRPAPMAESMAQAYEAEFADRLKEREDQARQAAWVARWYRSALGPGVDAKNKGWSKAVERWLVIGSAARRAAVALPWLIVIFQLAIGLWEWARPFTPPYFLRHAGTALAALVLPVLVAFLWSAWGNPARRRGIGIIWDVGTFWPRSFHPFTPPCYAEQAVPDLQRRMWWLHDNGGKVIMIAHSQGAILAAAAFAQDNRQPSGARTALATFGNPLTRLYMWGFPGYITPEFARPLIPGPGRRLRSWRNYRYATDPIGSLGITPLLQAALHLKDDEAQEHAKPPVPADVIRAIDSTQTDATKAADEAGTYADRLLLDPASCGFVYGTIARGPGAHSGYWSDSRVWDDIDRLATNLTNCARPCREAGTLPVRSGVPGAWAHPR
jgi:hypothetical protein